MGKSSPLAKGVRTFFAGLAGYAAAWATINWSTDYRAGAALVAVNVAAALVAGVAAAALAQSALSASTAIGKGIASMLQHLGAGLGGVAINSVADFAPAGRLIWATLIGAFAAGVVSLVQNAAEDGGAVG